jgi:Holliday junction resolvasome RuvABC endonuclease subunit
MVSTAEIEHPKFMGLDLSLTSTGVSVNGETFSIRPKTRGVERLIEISDKIVTLAINVQPVAAIIEGYSFGSKFSRAHSLGELGGVVKSDLHRAGFIAIEVPPKCRAKFATGNGNANKAGVLASLKHQFPTRFYDVRSDDECDAWVLEQMAYAKLNESEYSWSDKQLSALDRVDWEPLYEELRRNSRWSELLQ